MVAAAGERQLCRLFTDEYRSPIYVKDVAHAILDLLRLPVVPDRTTLHLGGPQRLSRYELGEAILRHHGLEQMARRSTRAEYSGPPRAPDTSFDSSRTYPLLSRPPRTLTEVLAGGGNV